MSPNVRWHTLFVQIEGVHSMSWPVLTNNLCRPAVSVSLNEMKKCLAPVAYGL